MNKKLWIWYVIVFAAFAAIVVGVVLSSEFTYKKTILSSRLEGYTDIVSRTDDYAQTAGQFPSEIRVTVIQTDGYVIYDSFEPSEMLGNHLSRPEISDALKKAEGCAIRKSDTFDKDYIYYARQYGNVVIRAALPFELPQRRFLHPDWTLLISIGLLFCIAVAVIVFLSRKFNVQADNETADKLRIQKQQMTNNIAHELRTPVTSIRGYMETLVNNPDMPDEKRQLFTERAYLQSLRLSDLIRDISLITKIEEAPEMLTKEHLGIRRITDEVFEEFTKALSEQHIRVENEIPEEISIKGNATLVYAIFRNLVENSVRYAGHDFSIHLQSRDNSDGTITFEYHDDGIGVEEEYMGRIFERFYRIPSESSDKSEGSGLGLSIVRNAVAFHGGSIQAFTMKPHGLGFRFSLRKL